VEETISIRRSEYELLLSVIAELREKVQQLQEELDALLSVDASGFHRKEQAFISRLQRHRQSILTFLLYPNVLSDNNASERAIRNVKVKTKVLSVS
jgi:hypothetical protein